MTKKEKHIDNLIEHGMEITHYKCDKCHEEEKDYFADSTTSAEFAYKDGWRATPNRVYCQKCAGKYLKLSSNGNL